MASYFKTDAPQMDNHLQFTKDFESGYFGMVEKIKKGCNIQLLAEQLRSEPVPLHSNMNDYFYEKGQWAAIQDHK